MNQTKSLLNAEQQVGSSARQSRGENYDRDRCVTDSGFWRHRQTAVQCTTGRVRVNEVKRKRVTKTDTEVGGRRRRQGESEVIRETGSGQQF